MTRSHDKSVQVNDALNRAGEIRGRLQLAEHATLAHRVAVSLLAAAYDDARAATLLIGNYGPDLVGSALSLVRPMNEKLRRGCWFFLGATEEQADQFLTHDRLPPSNVMVEAIEREEPFRSFPIFSMQHQNGINHLHSFTHGGNQIALPYMVTSEIGASYADGDVFHALESIEAIGITSVLVTIMVAGESNHELAQEVLNTFGREFNIPTGPSG
ncbi:DUF6988 family protein [Stenotrophomonas maltophilia]|uniref:DUF6988 family protein n=1 Tax=Stenotrophomonas maltophilia TaxID=40324 RepID=UPI0013DCF154|nr:hypothetical protein [Stenotrophomonas maltophilia]